MKKTVFLCLFWGICGFLFSQTIDSSSNSSGWKYKVSGIVDPLLYYDTRQVVGAREDELLFYPAPIVLDANGEDLNAVPNLNMLAITARLGLRVTAPDVLNAKVSAYVEGDFTGSTNAGINMFRLRHAFINMKWRRSDLLMGQFWHPMVVHEIMPNTRPLNMGVPFHPFSRFVQLRYVYRLGRFDLAATASFQLDNKFDGPLGANTEYLRNSRIPELNAQIFYRHHGLMLGLMYNYVVLQPRTVVTDAAGVSYKTNTMFSSHAMSVFGKYDFRGWRVGFQGIRGDNLYDQLMMGGYIESPFDVEHKRYYYEPFGCATAWVDFGRTRGLVRPGLFVGYGENTSFGEEVSGGSSVYGRGFDIDYLWRVQPRIGVCPVSYLNFYFEVEYTNARYGERVVDGDTYRYSSSYNVDNYRIMFTSVFFF